MSYTANNVALTIHPKMLDGMSVPTDVSLRSNDSLKTSTVSNKGEILCQ